MNARTMSACFTATALAMFLSTTAAFGQDDTVIDALSDEIDRSMTLQLEDLEKPYFVQYTVDDSDSYRMAASCGAISMSDRQRSRRLSSQVRVGYYDLDNTNFRGGGGRAFGGRRRGGRGGGGRGMGGSVALPTEDNYMAIRQAAWLSTDSAYKNAVETLEQKKAYMEDRNLPDRPADFTREDPLEAVGPKADLELDVSVWEDRLRKISAYLYGYEQLENSRVNLTTNADTKYLVNSEGSRIRRGETIAALTITAQALARDGESMSDRLLYHAATVDGLPAVEKIQADIDLLATRLGTWLESDPLEDYTGPVLFDGLASAHMFHELLARGVAGQAEPVGGGRRRFQAESSLDRYLGKRILPRSFQVYDDPRVPEHDDVYLTGHYLIDDEGVEARRVDVVVNGKLEDLLMSRTPTSKQSGSNGHGREAGFGRLQASAACLFIESGDTVPADELKKALLEAVDDQDLEYGIRVAAIGGALPGGVQLPAGVRLPQGFGGGRGGMGDPIAIYKVYPDGREELVRGCEFGRMGVGNLKDILAAGDAMTVYNTLGVAATSVVAPSVVFEEVELFPIEEERGTTPVVEAPHRRDG